MKNGKKIINFSHNLDIKSNFMMCFRKYSKLIEKVTVGPTRNIQLSSIQSCWGKYSQCALSQICTIHDPGIINGKWDPQRASVEIFPMTSMQLGINPKFLYS